MTDYQRTIPDEITKIIVFDTNAYRNFTSQLDWETSKTNTIKLKESEKKAGILAVANPYVIWELITHLADKTDPDYKNCLLALASLAEHTSQKEEEEVNLIVDSETAISMSLFEREPPTAQQNMITLSQLAGHVRKFGPSFTDENTQKNFKVFKHRMEVYKAQWLKDMEHILHIFSPKLIKDRINGNNNDMTKKEISEFLKSKECMYLFACAKVASITELLAIKLSPEEMKSKAEKIQEIFPVPFRLMKTQLCNWSNQKDINLYKNNRANFVMDTALCFMISQKLHIDNAPIKFITDDAAITAAAMAEKCEEQVMTLENYLDSINATRKIDVALERSSV